MRRLFAAAFAAGALALAWWGVERALDVDRHRARVARELSEWTGLPVSIERLDLRLRPLPRVSALGPAIGEGELQLRARSIDLVPRLGALLERRLELVRIEVVGLDATLPDDPERWTEAWQEIAERVAARSGERREDDDAALSVEVRSVAFEDAVVRRASDAAELLRADATVRLERGAVALEGELAAPRLGAEIEGALRWGSGSGTDDERAISGALALRGLRTDALAPLPEALRAAVDARLSLAGEPGRRLEVDFQGELDPDAPAGLAGPVRGRLALDLSGAAQADFELETNGGRARGAWRGADDAAAPTLDVESLDLSGQTLHTLLAALESDSLALGGDGASIAVRGLRIALPPDAAPRAEAGALSAEGVEVAWQGRELDTPWSAAARVEDGALRIEALESGPVSLSGSIAPEPEAGRHTLPLAEPEAGRHTLPLAEPEAGRHTLPLTGPEARRHTLSLTGRAALGPDWLAPLGAPPTLAGLSGQLALESLRWTLPPDEGSPLRFRLRLRDGALALEGEAYRDAFTGLDLALSGEGGALALEGSGHSERLGALRASARRGAEPGAPLAGWVELDASGLAAAFAEPELAERLGPALRQYGASRLDFTLREAEADALRLEVERRPPGPPFAGAATLHTESERALVGDLLASTTVPGAALSAALPDGARLGGHVELRLRRSEAEDRFVVDLEAAPLALGLGPWIEKRAGEPLSLAVAGGAGFAPETLSLNFGRGGLRFTREDGSWIARDLALELADANALLPDGVALTGRARGELALSPLRAALRLDGAGWQLSPALPPVRLDGALEIAAGALRSEGLRLRAPETDLEIAGEWSDSRLAGRLVGPSLAVGLLRAHLDFARALGGEEQGPALDAPARRESRAPADAGEGANGRSGEVEIAIDRLALPRGDARALRARVQLEQGALRVAPAAFEAYQGRVQGELALGADDRLELSVALEGVTGRFLDDLFFPDAPRGLRGKVDAALRFAGPLGADGRETMARGSGSLSASGVEGSLGRLGLATRLLTVLRASEVLRLRVPSVRDEGLVFDRLDASLAMRDGVMQIERFDLDAKAYALGATGELDFAADTSRVSVELNAIRGVTAIFEPIPVAGDALKIANVRLTGSGSPWAMRFGIASFRDQVLGAAQAGSQATVGRVRDALRLLRGRGAGGAAEEPQAPPAPPAGETPPEAPAPAPAPATEAPVPEPAPDAPAPQPEPGEPVLEPEREPELDAPAPEPEPDAPAPDAADAQSV